MKPHHIIYMQRETADQPVRPAAVPGPVPVSVVVAAHNAASTLGACLDAVLADLPANGEVIVVDDGSTDRTAGIAARDGVRCVRIDPRAGVAAARNRGAQQARAGILFFVDADVVIAPGTIARGLAALADPETAGVIGSYDDEPPVRTTVSLFKNLAHHYFHQRSGGLATTFWGACGVIRRDVFDAVGGFDEHRWSIVEDIELGCRLVDRGARLRLDPGLTVKHLKQWTLRSLVTTDVMLRAIPWALLAFDRRELPRRLNFGGDQQLAAALAVLIVPAGIAAPFHAGAGVALAGAVAAAVWINRGLYALFWRKGGVRLAVGGFLLQQVYYLYSCGSVAAALLLRLAYGPAAIEAPWRPHWK